MNALKCAGMLAAAAASIAALATGEEVQAVKKRRTRVRGGAVKWEDSAYGKLLIACRGGKDARSLDKFRKETTIRGLQDNLLEGRCRASTDRRRAQ